MMTERRAELVAAAISTLVAAYFIVKNRHRRRSSKSRVKVLEAERDVLKEEKKLALATLMRYNRWACDVKAKGCCIPHLQNWPPKSGTLRYHCKKCNWDACSTCIPLVENRQCPNNHILTESAFDPTREEKRHAAYERNEAARHALVSNEKALATAAHRLELYETAHRVRTALEAANRAAVQAESCLAVYDSNAGAAAPALRSALILACDASTSSRELLESVVDGGIVSSRKGFLRALHELIPRPVPHVSDGTGGEWKEEWASLTEEWAKLTEQFHLKTWLKHVKVLDNCIETHREYIDACVARGWLEEHAIALWLLQSRIKGLARALRERDACYAHSLYTLTTALVAAARRQREPAPKLYANLTGKFGLVLGDDNWERLEVPDRYGFRGLSSVALIKAACGPNSFGIHTKKGAEHRATSGFAAKVVRTRPTRQETYEVQDSAVVCFESGPPSADSLHSAIMVSEEQGFFPPNTLFRLKSISPSFIAPNGVHVEQTLYTVSATYRPPPSQAVMMGSVGSKLCATRPIMLSYADRQAYVNGLDDVVISPMLLIAQEFDRDMAWVDYGGKRHTARECWEYVNGPASRLEGCTPGVRDVDNDGKTPEDFLREANTFIRTRRWRLAALMNQISDGGAPSSQPGSPDGPVRQQSMMADEHALLTRDEVLAVRLYSGPAFQPLNSFLRQISTLNGAARSALVSHPGLTFAATVGHVCSAIRKLAAVATPEEAKASVFRGVRGALPKGFFEPDAHGAVLAVEMGFMSCSKRRATPIEYMMGDGDNVLWQLLQSGEDDAGFHSGADISMLSQFAGEEEVLFPPITMLVVQRRTLLDRDRVDGAGAEVTEGG